MTDQTGELTYINLDLIDADEAWNCRGPIFASEVSQLADNIKSHGLIQPVTLTPKNGRYKLVAGFRRFKAHQLNESKAIKALIRHDLTEEQCKIINLTENFQRSDLNIVQEARAVRGLLSMTLLSRSEVASQLNKSLPWLEIRLIVDSFSEDLQKLCAMNVFTNAQIRRLDKLKSSKEEQIKYAREIYDRKLKSEKTTIFDKPRPKSDIQSKRQRKKVEIFMMINHLLLTFGQSLSTRALAWANGEISELELYEEIKAQADNEGIDYEIPMYGLTLQGEAASRESNLLENIV